MLASRLNRGTIDQHREIHSVIVGARSIQAGGHTKEPVCVCVYMSDHVHALVDGLVLLIKTNLFWCVCIREHSCFYETSSRFVSMN